MDRVRYRSWLLPVLVLVTGSGGSAAAEHADAEGLAFFESKIRPVLVEHCYKCHSAESEKVKGGLLLDTREGIRKGGDSGAAVVPGDPAGSLLLAAISHDDPDLEMPPKKDRLSSAIIADFKRWIAMGAPDPREGGDAVVANKPPVSIEAGREFWAFVKPAAHPLPKTASPEWAKRDLDHFILAKLEENGLAPSPDAEPAVLLRRVHFDLAGLPPSPAAVDAFLNRIEKRGIDAALEAEVDGLLASPHFGERWGRHWMDVARFAESSGKESNLTFPHAWRYRDYVIDSFNADKPFDRFITEQVAGDLLPFETGKERVEYLVATGFLAFGPKSLNEMNRLQFFADLVDEQIDTVSRSIMANSVACARCHDHKFDPYSMKDYYALAGIFASTETFYGTWVGSENNVGGNLITLPEIEGQLIPNRSMTPQNHEKLKAKLAALNQEEIDRRAAAKKAMKEGRDPSEHFNLRDALRILWQRGGVEGQLETVGENGEALPLCMGVLERDQVIDAPLLERGEIASPGEKVKRGFPEIIEIDGVASISAEESGRLEFAQWLTHADHPLTARVMANRVWRWLIGEGLVRTVDNFGFNGERPSHPELLDSLALRFSKDWSVKALVREIVMSRAYRQRSDWDERKFLADPDNRLLWRANKRRMDAECIRDAMLMVSGNLEPARRPGSLIADLGDRSVSLFGFSKEIPSDLDGCHYRSVYLPVVRDRLPDALELFDFAEPSLVEGDRETTNVPVQSLYLMNSTFVRAQAEAFAARLQSAEEDPGKRIELAFRLCYGRPPDGEERAMSRPFLSGKETMIDFCQGLLATAEFRNLD